MDTSSNPIPFSPAPHLIDAIVADLGNAAASLDDIAARSHTTVEALAHWMTSPEIAARLAATDAAITWRTRLLASRTLPLVVLTLNKILQDYHRATDRGLGGERSVLPHSNFPGTPDSTQNPLRAAIVAQRARETARIAATTLLRLRRIFPIGQPPAPNTSTAPAQQATPTTPISEPTPTAPAPPPSPHPTSDIPNPTSPVDAAYIAATADLEALIALLAKINPPDSAEPPTSESAPSGGTASSLPVSDTRDVNPAPSSDSLDTSDSSDSSATSDSFVPFPHPTSDIAHPTFPLELTPAGASHEHEHEQNLAPSRASWP